MLTHDIETAESAADTTYDQALDNLVFALKATITDPALFYQLGAALCRLESGDVQGIEISRIGSDIVVNES